MAKTEVTSSEMREFLLVLRQALLIIVKFIERRYMSPPSAPASIEMHIYEINPPHAGAPRQ